jgi:AhpD family alkylhydroperoxidase
MVMISTPVDFRYPWYVSLIFWLQRRKYGVELEPARLWGRTPSVFLGLAGLYRAIDRAGSPIDPALRSMVTVRVSQINWCEFCVDINSATALERSVDAAKLSELADFEHSPHYSAREKAALRYAETVTITGRRVDAAQMSELKAHFSDDAIIELTALIAFQNLSSKFNAALHVPAQGFCRIPPGPTDVAGQAPQKIAK